MQQQGSCTNQQHILRYNLSQELDQLKCCFLICACVAAVLADSSCAVQAQEQKQFSSVFMAMLSLPGMPAGADPCSSVKLDTLAEPCGDSSSGRPTQQWLAHTAVNKPCSSG
jgi:hypothetical protein